MYLNGIVNTATEEGESNPFSIAPPEIFKIGNFSVTSTVVSGFLTVVLLLGFFLAVRIFFIPRWEKQPFKKSGFRIIMEKLVTMFDKTAREQTHAYANLTGSLYLGLASYICIATLIELFGLRPATTDLNLTFTLGIITFLLIFSLGFIQKKHRRLMHYLNPLNWVTDAIVPFTMGIRVFASIFSGYIVLHLLYSYWYLSIFTPVIANVLLTLMHAGMQAFIYMFLSMSFINEAIEAPYKPPRAQRRGSVKSEGGNGS